MDLASLRDALDLFSTGSAADALTARNRIRDALQPAVLGELCSEPGGAPRLRTLCADVTDSDICGRVATLLCGVVLEFCNSDAGAASCAAGAPGIAHIALLLVTLLGRDLDVAAPASDALAALMKQTAAAQCASTTSTVAAALQDCVREPLVQLRLFRDKRCAEENAAVVAFASDHTDIASCIFSHAVAAVCDDPLEFLNALMAIDIVATSRGLEALPPALTQVLRNILLAEGAADPSPAVPELLVPFTWRFVGSVVHAHEANAKFAVRNGWLAAAIAALPSTSAHDVSKWLALLEALAGVVSTEAGLRHVTNDGAAASAVRNSVESALVQTTTELRVRAIETVEAALLSSAAPLAAVLFPVEFTTRALWPLHTCPTEEVRLAMWRVCCALCSAPFATTYVKTLGALAAAFLAAPSTLPERVPAIRGAQLAAIDALLAAEGVRPFHERLSKERAKGLYVKGGTGLQVAEDVDR